MSVLSTTGISLTMVLALLFGGASAAALGLALWALGRMRSCEARRRAEVSAAEEQLERFREAVARLGEAHAELESLRCSEQAWKCLFSAAPFAISVLREGRFANANPSMEFLFGYEPGELIGLTPETLGLSTAELVAMARASASKTMEASAPGIMREVSGRHRDGTSVAMILGAALLEPGGASLDCVLVAVDVAEQRRLTRLAEERARSEAANQAQRRFLGHMSHEVRTPMNAILGFAQLLSRDPEVTPQQRDYIRLIHRSGEHLIELIDNILNQTGEAKGPTGPTPLRTRALERSPSESGRASDRPLARLCVIGTACRILVADDEETNRQLMRRLLESEQVEIREATNGAEAVELCVAWRPQVILMDLRMPVLDGAKAIQRIRALDTDARDAKILLLTAATLDEDVAVLRACGADDVLGKPFDVDELIAKVADLLPNLLRPSSAMSTTGASVKEGGSATNGSSAYDEVSLACLEPATRAALRQGVMEADVGRIVALSEEIGVTYPRIAARLRELAGQFDYGRLMELLNSGERTQQ